MVERRTLDDPRDAVVQLELQGVTFNVKDDRLSFAGLPADPATSEFLRVRLDLIRQNKAQAIEWLSSRTDADILAQVEKTVGFLSDQVSYSEVWRDGYGRKAETWRRVLILALEKQAELETRRDNERLPDVNERGE